MHLDIYALFEFNSLQFLVSKVEIEHFMIGTFLITLTQLEKTLPIDPVFSSWVNVIKKVSIIKCSRNFKSLKGI